MMPRFRIGTYNVENLYDRFDDPYELGDDAHGRYRTHPKPRAQLFDLGKRIRKSRVDVLGIQEVENFGALKDFVQTSVGPKFKVTKGIVTQQSNDRRGIDLGILSSLPLGRVVSHRFNEFTLANGEDYRFARDCLQVEILDRKRSQILVTVLYAISSRSTPNLIQTTSRRNTSRTKRTAPASALLRRRRSPGSLNLSSISAPTASPFWATSTTPQIVLHSSRSLAPPMH